ncbi:DUF5057 domain-containing protein [Peribacillus sp. NPDC097197]|uniref:DUF5057 domain-containing protein n=1 Tax=Peribacillus sp. NPDC097197 TaxID=3390615 RepID=UPI003D0109E8
MKKSVGLVLSLVLLFSFLFLPKPLEAAVQTSGPKLRILEIVASGNSQLRGILGENSYEYTLITMKKFVAQREELDGKYDVIAIMEGNYTSDPVKNKEHNTSAVMNDITNLKANEIINDFINKGQPVILNTKSLATGSKLKAKFNDQNLLSKSNVINYDSTSTNSSGSFWDRWNEFWYGSGKNNNESTQTDKDNMEKAFNNFLKGDKYKQSPRFTLTKSPDKEKIYQPNENMEFTMNVVAPSDFNSRSLKAKLYIDSNFDDKYTTDEIVLEENVTSKSMNLSFKLPKGYSGVRYWKMELVDSGNNLKSYEKGMIKFVDKKVEVKVLQVYTNEKSSLKRNSNPNNMNQSYLNSNEYSISIDATSMDTFNKSKKEETSYSHEVINGKYDMVIFGFADSYNRSANINTNAVASLKRFIASKQSIMFTHDTIFENNNNWVNNFMNDTGQISPQTNLGYGAPNTSRTTKKINDGLMTTYPYALKNELSVALTHNQYYTLDLEDPEIIPWYNITGNSRDENDSWNHYYTYSKGNITYSGTGHKGGSDSFPDDEQKLFVNTMYRAFLGSNHAPEITIHTPTENQVIPLNQNIELSYTLQDYDLKDKNLSTKVFMDEKEVSEEKDVINGSTINMSLPHNLQDSKVVTIKVQATDQSGAVSEKEVKVKVQKINANLEVSRILKSNNLVEVGQPVEIEYTVTPKKITGIEAQAISGNSVTLEAMALRESFPADLEVTSDGTKSGTASTGISLEKTLSIVYKKVGNDFVASPLTFSVHVTPTAKKQYILANSILRYKDLTNIQKELTFNTLTFNADFALTGIDFPDSYVLSKGTEKNFSIDLKKLPADAGVRSISWSEESRGNILDLNPASGTAKVIKEGNTFLKVKVTDNFGNVFEKRVPLTVRIPVNSFTLTDLTLHVGETLPLPVSNISPKDGKSSLEIVLGNNDIARVNKEDFTITGLTTGETLMTVTGIDSNGNLVEHTSIITVRKVPVTGIEVDRSSVTMNKFDVVNDIRVIIVPSNATDKTVEWKSLDESIVEVVENGKIKGVSTGTANIEITSKSNPEVKATIKVQVGQPLEGIRVPEITLQKGTSQPIIVHHSPADATNVDRTDFSPLKNDYITISNGVVHGVRVGKTEITVTVADDTGKKYNAIVKVTVTQKKEEGSNDNQDKY